MVAVYAHNLGQKPEYFQWRPLIEMPKKFLSFYKYYGASSSELKLRCYYLLTLRSVPERTKTPGGFTVHVLKVFPVITF